MKKGEGFFLLELMISFMCASLLFTIFFRFIQSSWISLRAEVHETASHIQYYMIHECLKSDIHDAPALCEKWYECSLNHIMWTRSDGKTISWEVQKKVVTRKEGYFDTFKKLWRCVSTMNFPTTREPIFSFDKSYVLHGKKYITCVMVQDKVQHKIVCINPQGEHYLE